MMINTEKTFDEALVLVIYDNMELSSELNTTLTTAGLKPIFVNRAEKGFTVIKHAKESGTPLALVICDTEIGDMPAENFVHAVRSDPLIADTNIIMLAREGSSGNLTRYSPLGVSHFAKWPSHNNDLVTAIAEYIPVRRESQFGGALDQSSSEEAPRQMRILAADDNTINLAVLRGFLNLAGYSPDTVVNGAEAVKAFKNKHYDLILMDISMPVMDGVVATLQIREIEKRIGKAPVPIIAVTAHFTPSQRQRYLEAGMNDVISKPIRQERIAACLAKWNEKQSNDLEIPRRATG